ncbi:MAG: neocarzinostatin apoprotein domain-containing protein, partial [Acidimicrobiales bacterium]
MSRRAAVSTALLAVLLAAAGPMCGAAAGAPVIGSARAQVAASLVVTPATDLVEGQTVTVEGIGWVPGNTVGLCEAVALDPPSEANCHQGLYTTATVDELGGFTVVLTVHAEIDVPSLGHVVDCTSPTQPCVVGAADGADVVGTATSAPLAFTQTATVPGVPTGMS